MKENSCDNSCWQICPTCVCGSQNRSTENTLDNGVFCQWTHLQQAHRPSIAASSPTPFIIAISSSFFIDAFRIFPMLKKILFLGKWNLECQFQMQQTHQDVHPEVNPGSEGANLSIPQDLSIQNQALNLKNPSSSRIHNPSLIILLLHIFFVTGTKENRTWQCCRQFSSHSCFTDVFLYSTERLEGSLESLKHWGVWIIAWQRQQMCIKRNCSHLSREWFHKRLQNTPDTEIYASSVSNSGRKLKLSSCFLFNFLLCKSEKFQSWDEGMYFQKNTTGWWSCLIRTKDAEWKCFDSGKFWMKSAE